MTSIGALFNHFMSLINIRYYTKQESDDKYLRKQDFGLIIDNEGVLRIVTEDDSIEGNNVYVGDIYSTKGYVDEKVESILTSLGVSSDYNNGLFLISNKKIIQNGDECKLIALVYDSNRQAISNANVTFNIYDNDDNLIDTLVSTTNYDGVASVNYTGDGIGLLKIRTEYNSLVSETYKVIDGMLLVRDSETFEGSSGARDYYRTGMGVHSWNPPLCIEFDVEAITNPSYMRFRIFEQDGTPAWVRNFNEIGVTGSCHIKIVVTENHSEWFVDGESKYNPSVSTIENPLRIGFTISGGQTSITVKNFVIYPI